MEIENLKVAFDTFPDDKSPLVHNNKASVSLIFDAIIMLERNSIWINDGHKTPQPEWLTFAGVVSHEIIRTVLTYTALNDIPVFGDEIQNSYLQAPSTEKHCIISGPEFGLDNEGKIEIIF